MAGLDGFQQGAEVNLTAFQNKVVINNKFVIPVNQIKRTMVYTGMQIAEYEKSVIRALIGGLVFGGIGAIVGGLTGIGKKQKDQDLLYLSVEFQDRNKEERAIVFAVTDPSSTAKLNINQMSKKLNKVIGYKENVNEQGQIVL
ncbi:hypothetical protein [Brevibacillus migulae]|uniref:hypothetical protein n=1 Tax=Brevibacillus migulae TaxID=1644114 RepID=UPI00106EB384|nr:hypothetical protein [Brevibacillus migulae]